MSENQNNQEPVSEQPEILKKSEEKVEKVEKVEKGSDSQVKIALILGVLTFASALILSVLNLLTAPVISDRLQSEKADSVKNLFGGDIITEELQGYEDLYINYTAKVLEILYVRDKTSQELAGYCVTVAPKGFNGNIDMLVAVNLDCTVIDTVILNMSETAGSGTKIDDNSFKEQFKNKTRNIKANEVTNINSIDTIANATVSSKAFLNGVNAALAVVNDILNLNSESTIVEPNELIPDETGATDDDDNEEYEERENMTEEIAESEEAGEESVTIAENE